MTGHLVDILIAMAALTYIRKTDGPVRSLLAFVLAAIGAAMIDGAGH